MKVTKIIAVAALAIFSMSFTLPGAEQETYQFSLTSSALTWKSETIDLGKIPHNKPVKVKFEFTNSSSEPVIVSNVVTSCGCTGAEYPKEPIGPSKSSEISVTYNAAAIGTFSKTITVELANNESKQLVIKGTVLE